MPHELLQRLEHFRFKGQVRSSENDLLLEPVAGDTLLNEFGNEVDRILVPVFDGRRERIAHPIRHHGQALASQRSLGIQDGTNPRDQFRIARIPLAAGARGNDILNHLDKIGVRQTAMQPGIEFFRPQLFGRFFPMYAIGLGKHSGVAVLPTPEFYGSVHTVIPDRTRSAPKSAGSPVMQVVERPTVDRVVTEHAAYWLAQTGRDNITTDQRTEGSVLDLRGEEIPLIHISDRASSQAHEKHRCAESIEIVGDRPLATSDSGRHRGFNGLAYRRLPP